MNSINTINQQNLIELRFDSGDSWCAGSFYRPYGKGPFPTIVMAHGLGGVKSMRLPAFAERFVAAGYACLLFDYRHFGESGGQPRQIIDIKKQLEDWKNAVFYVGTRPDVIPSKIILWGTSFAGGHVLSTAADISNIAAVISQCPFTDGLSSGLAMNPITSVKVSTLAIRDHIASWLGKTPIYVPLAGLPGQTALMNAYDAYQGYLSLFPENSDIPNYAAARIALDIIRYYPGRRTPEIEAPVLFCICDSDTVAPSKATLRHANRTKRKVIKSYSEGHFEIYIGQGFEHVIRDQIDFLHRTVPVQ